MQALATQFVGGWVFSRFDETDPGTRERWSKVPKEIQQEILTEAPKAILEVTKDAMIKHLQGVPDQRSAYMVEGAGVLNPESLVIRTVDEGRKDIRFGSADTMRVEDLDKKDSFVTIFVRKAGAAPAPLPPPR
ncbi:MAG: hypothetical protein NVS3B20_01070 [Polyangiales bacterium]